MAYSRPSVTPSNAPASNSALVGRLLQCTPEDHPDREEIPTVSAVLTSVVKASQVSCHPLLRSSRLQDPAGIESAEAKIKLWNVAERLLFRKGETIVKPNDPGDSMRVLTRRRTWT